jgi:predicted amidohydrolase
MRFSTRNSRQLIAATVALTPDSEPQVTFKRMEAVVERAKRVHDGVRLILFGETILGWFYRGDQTGAYHHSIAESIPGPLTDRVADLARKHRVYICFGLTETEDGVLYNAQVLLSPDGDVIAKHRKFLIRNKIFTQGAEKLTLASVDGVKVALLVCADVRSGELIRAIRRERVDLVLASLSDDSKKRILNRLMSALLDAWVLVANRYGEEGAWLWSGLISVSDPWLRLRGWSIGEENVLIRSIRVTRIGHAARCLRRVLVGGAALGWVILLGMQSTWETWIRYWFHKRLAP